MPKQNYFFVCPKCGDKISMFIDTDQDIPEDQLFTVDCPRSGCGWTDDLPFSQAYRLPS